MNPKIFRLYILILCFTAKGYAQVGIGTTTPNSSLQVLGSFATNYRAFTAATTAGTTDQVLVFTGSSATTITLPTAVGITGRSYLVKNAGSGGTTPVLTVATTSSQTIDGITSWTWIS